MALPVYRLRRWLAATAVALSLVVAGMYFYARTRVRDALKEIPHKIPFEIKQTANGFQFSKSDGKRTLFTIQASDLKEFKLNGRAELHNVNIVLYGRDSSRFDQIYGDDFAYDPQTGDVTAKGEVQIDLVANPAGLTSPDQSTPKELKNPIHLKTRDLVFNRETGNASTNAQVEFRTPQATGSAVGVKYAGKSNTLTLSSNIHVVLSGARAAAVDAEQGVITGDPRQIVLDHAHLAQQDGRMEADQAVFYLNSDNRVERVLATGNVRTVTQMGAATSGKRSSSTDDGQSREIRGRADQGEFLLAGEQERLRQAFLSGNVHIEQSGDQPMQGDAGRLVLDYAGQNQLQRAHALDGVRLRQNRGSNPGANASPQDFELTAPAIDFMVVNGNALDHAETFGAAQIRIASAQDGTSTMRGKPQQTMVTAAKFVAEFASEALPPASRKGGEKRGTPDRSRAKVRQTANYLASIHGAPGARVVNSSPGQPDRVSTSESVDAAFLPLGGIESLSQQGNVAYSDGEAPDKRTQAWANTARYTPADELLLLTGNPRISNGGMVTTAKTISMARGTGDALAEGDVKSTYSDLKEQPDGALLASSSPIHVTARTMSAHNAPGVALYSGNARLWQDANVIEAPSIQFDRDRRFVTAQGTVTQPAQTILVQAKPEHANPAQARTNDSVDGGAQRSESMKAKKDRNSTRSTSQSDDSTPIAITAAKLTYADSERKVHYEGGVLAKGADFTASADTVDAYLVARRQASKNQSFEGPGQLDHLVAQGNVVVQEPKRKAEGQHLVYTAADDKFVLTGGPPSIFDAEQGKITGVSLTFFKRDDRVLVEGEASTPVVTQTRVAR
jgi:lipopolysaccharide export system protein LptA